jgi:hypothetical protein
MHDQFHVIEQKIDLFDHQEYFYLFLNTRFHLDQCEFQWDYYLHWDKKHGLIRHHYRLKRLGQYELNF